MSTLFIADLHLEDKRPDLNRAFLSFCQRHASNAESLYILGDLFNAWVGDDDNSDTSSLVKKALRKLTQSGVSVFLLHGNRDFLIGKKLIESCGARLLPESVVIQPYDQPILLMHGDQLCTDDVDYQQFRTMLRSPKWQQQFLQKPLSERQQIARDLREKSREANRVKPEDIMDVSDKSVIETMSQHAVSLMIHGHTHRPNIHTHLVDHDGLEYTRIVLGDWESNLWYLNLDPNGSYALLKEPIPL